MRWGLPPSVFDALPLADRVEMRTFWSWRIVRMKAAHDLAAKNARFFKGQS